MHLGTKLIKNMSYLTVGNQVGNLLQFLFFLYFARRFGDNIVGQYSFAFSFTYLFAVFADLGLSTYLMREVARNQSGTRQVFARCLGLRLLSIALSAMAAIGVVLVFFGRWSGDTLRIILLFGLFQIFFSLGDVFQGELKGHDRMGTVAVLNILIRLILSGTGVLLIFLRFDFLTVLTCFPIASFIYLLACIYFSLSYFGDIRPHLGNLHLKELFITTLPFTFTIILVETLYHQDILMIKFLQGDQAVGVYSVANTIILALMSVLVFVHVATLPTFSRLFLESRQNLIAVSRKTLRYLLWIGLPMATGLYAISDKLMVFLYTESFRSSAGVLKILSAALALNFAATTYSVLLTAINRQTLKAAVFGACLALNFALNIFLIPALSSQGAALSKLGTEALHLILMAYLVSRYLSPIALHRAFVKPALSSLVMYVFIQMFHPWNLFYLITASAAVYAVSFGAMRGYSREEAAFLKRLWPRVLLPGNLFKTPSSRK